MLQRCRGKFSAGFGSNPSREKYYQAQNGNIIRQGTQQNDEQG